MQPGPTLAHGFGAVAAHPAGCHAGAASDQIAPARASTTWAKGIFHSWKGCTCYKTL